MQPQVVQASNVLRSSVKLEFRTATVVLKLFLERLAFYDAENSRRSSTILSMPEPDRSRRGAERGAWRRKHTQNQKMHRSLPIQARPLENQSSRFFSRTETDHKPADGDNAGIS